MFALKDQGSSRDPFQLLNSTAPSGAEPIRCGLIRCARSCALHSPQAFVYDERWLLRARREGVTGLMGGFCLGLAGFDWLPRSF